MMTEKVNLNKDYAKKELWYRGSLRWKLDSAQKELYDLFYNSKHKILTWLLSRRNGKTYTLCVLAVEQCIRKPNSIVKFVSPTKLQVNNNIRPILRQILEDCPDEIKPEFRRQEYIYYFPNGSEIQLAGSDSGHAEKLRGGDSDLFLIDEAGSCADLDNVVKSILLPTTLITKGKGVLASTPPKDFDHDFVKYIEEADQRGSLIKKTVLDNPRITKEQLDELILELGGPNTSETRRELYCELIKDSNSSVIPEFTDELEKEIIKEWPRPPFFDAYEAMDTGGKDFTVVLYGYYDFRADKLVIEDETVIDFAEKNVTIETLTKNINKKENDLWKNAISLEYKAPHLRVSDIDYILINEIYHYSEKLFPKEQRIAFQNTKKDNNEAAINTLRTMLAHKKIIIHPRCQTLIRHLRNVKWDKNKTKFARSIDNGHYDAVDALKYFVRSVEYRKNPYPSHYDYNLKDLHVRNKDILNTPNTQIEVYKRLFNIPIKRKF